MADQTRIQATALKEKILKNGSGYAFYQAYRLLRLIAAVEGSEGRVHVRPNLSLAFPETDIDEIVQFANGEYQITANFLGLYGVSSPLPTFYTEDLLEEFRSDRHGQRDFLDLINVTIYPLLLKVWFKSRLFMSSMELGDRSFVDIFFSFIGVNNPDEFRNQPGFESLIRFAGIFASFPRSALGLETILKGVYKEANVEILQCQQETAIIPVEQRSSLGKMSSTLGMDCHLGSQILDCSNNLTVCLSDVSETLFRSLIPGQIEFSRIKFLVRNYLVDPLNIKLKLVLSAGAAQGNSVGSTRWGMLGQDTWLAPERIKTHEVSYVL